MKKLIDEQIQELELIESIENSSQEGPKDFVKSYECGTGFLIVVNVAETLQVHFTADEDFTKPGSLIQWAICIKDDLIKKRVTRCSYGIDKPSIYAVDVKNFTGECVVCVVGDYNYFKPIEIVRSENLSSDEYRVFTSPAAAREWIESGNDRRYFLKHGQVGPAECYIWWSAV